MKKLFPEKQNDSKNQFVYIYSSQSFGITKFYELKLCNFINNPYEKFWKKYSGVL